MSNSVVVAGAGVGGGAALRAAAGAGDVTACARLLGSAARSSVRFSRDELGRSALHLAASAGHGPVVRLLLNAAAHREVDSPDGAGCTALQRAAADGHEDVVRLLLARGAEVDKQDTVHGNSALHEAAWKGYSRTVKLLVSAGADLSKTNAGGFTALHLCCQNGHNQSCRELLLGGCDADLQNNYGDTALHTAARYGHAGVTRILISAQCRISEQNKNGDTALHIAAAMGRRKLTRILLEAACDKNVRNKQNETAKDIALRKDLNEILNILEDVPTKKEKKSSKSIKKRSKSKVRFEKTKDATDGGKKPQQWSPYGCHYYPDPEAFPPPKLDSLPNEPLKRGEQYYSDLAGNIKKGPVGMGYTCYCAPLFRHLEARLEKDKRELQRAQVRLGQRVAGLEQKINRGIQGRRSERVLVHKENIPEVTLPRSRSLEVLDKQGQKGILQSTRSMDELEPPEEVGDEGPRRSVKEIVAMIQHQSSKIKGDNSESSDDDDSPLRMTQHDGPMGDSNLAEFANVGPSYENLSSNDVPRSRIGVYSPTSLIDSNTRYIEPSVKIHESNIRYNEPYMRHEASGYLQGEAGFRPASVSPLRDSYSASPRDSTLAQRDSLSNPHQESPKRTKLPYVKHDNPSTSRPQETFTKPKLEGYYQGYDETGIRYDNSPLYFPYPDPSYYKHNAPNYNQEPTVRVPESSARYFEPSSSNREYYEQNTGYTDANVKYSDMNTRFAKLRMLDSTKLFDSSKNVIEGSSRMLDSQKMFESTTRMLENPQDVGDRDTNNDSGYSTKVYGSSKGNSPSLSGQLEPDCLGASSLV